MKITATLITVLCLTSCASTDKWLLEKTGLDTAAIITLGLSTKLKGEQLKKEYEVLKAVEVTAQK
jgi:hypothetical protein